MTYKTLLLEKTHCKKSGLSQRWYSQQAELLLRLVRQKPKSIFSFGWQEFDVLLFGGPSVIKRSLKRRLH